MQCKEEDPRKFDGTKPRKKQRKKCEKGGQVVPFPQSPETHSPQVCFALFVRYSWDSVVNYNFVLYNFILFLNQS